MIRCIQTSNQLRLGAEKLAADLAVEFVLRLRNRTNPWGLKADRKG